MGKGLRGKTRGTHRRTADGRSREPGGEGSTRQGGRRRGFGARVRSGDAERRAEGLGLDREDAAVGGRRGADTWAGQGYGPY
jgi:hypothetical protein